MGLKLIGGYTSPGIPGGQVNSITAVCPLVVDSSDPVNPEISLPVTRDTQANILNMQISGTLCDGAFYTITDMPSPVLEATFQAILESLSGFIILQKYGQGESQTGVKMNIGFDLATSYLFYVEIPTFNQIARRQIGGASNNIDKILWENSNWTNIDVNEGIFNNIHASMQFNNVRSFGSSVLCTFGAVANITHAELIQATVQIISSCTIISLFINEGSLVANSACSFLTIQPISQLTTNGHTVDSVFIGENMTIILQDDLLVATVTQNFSSAVLSISASANYAGTAFTLPGDYQYAGKIILTNNAGGLITEIALGSGTWLPMKKIFTCADGITNDFKGAINVVAATPDQIVGDATIAGVTNTITGRINGLDFIEIVRSGDVNQVVNMVVNV